MGKGYTNSIKKKCPFVLQKIFMKNILLTICFSPFMLGAVELHPQEECESYKHSLSNAVANLQLSADTLHTDIGYVTYGYIDVGLARQDFNYKASIGTDSARDAYRYCADSIYLERAQLDVSNSYVTLDADYSVITNNLSSIRSLISDVDCTQCSISNSSSCCDFTDIISAINSCKSELVALGSTTSQILQSLSLNLPLITQSLSDIDSHISLGFYNVTELVHSCNIVITNMLYQISDTVSIGFENTTNILNSIYDVDSSGWGVSTNYFGMMYSPEYADEWLWHSPEMLTQLRYPSYLNGHFVRFYGEKTYFNNDKWEYGSWIYGLAPTIYLMMQEIVGGAYAQNAWLQYQHDYMYPPITNILTTTYIQQTNYFSFFRGELGVNGVLSDWTPQDGAYYDFLTNHYLAIMRGDTLSPSLSTKTNWFSRIETLLSALVFPDSHTTNVVDSSAYSQQQQALQGAISSVNNSASSSFSSFSSSANSIVSLFQSYVQTFDDVALPGRFVFFTLSNVDGDSDVVSFSMSENPALNLFVEGCRAVTTFCWASVGIFCLLRFMVWACRGIFYACVFFYKAISAVLH